LLEASSLRSCSARTTEEEDPSLFLDLFLLTLGVTEKESFERSNGVMLCAAVDAAAVGTTTITPVVLFKRYVVPSTLNVL
jgi:hypothetical protein